ncbi:MAG: DNA mismatch repair protein MutS [Acidobacteria bacterium]|nr:DNA mismatch repair protein MutS [Acidobacteriota bacterium]
MSPQQEYQRRFDQQQTLLQAAQALSEKFWRTRRVLFIALLVFAALAVAGWLPAFLSVLPLVLFIVAIVRHQRVIETIERATRTANYYDYGLARLRGAWMGKGNAGERFKNAAHPYAEDLDIFGAGSLFELLCTARTRAGEERLAAWLLAPAMFDEIRTRQQAVNELRDKLDLRADLALLGDAMNTGVHHAELAAWGDQPARFTARVLQIVAAVLGVITLAAAVAWLVGYGRQYVFAALIAETGFLLYVRHEVGRVISELERPSRDLRLLTQVLERVEQEQFTSSALSQLRAALDTNGLAPSQQIARLHRLGEILDWCKNQFFAPLAFALLIPAQIAIAAERWKQECGPQVAHWLDALAEFEALNSLAGYAYEHPDDPFPELVEVFAQGALFDGQQIGHPLIAEARCIRNDVKLTAQQSLLIVSGSNMSGKSTLMRTVGVNVTLALAGAPVRAQRLRLSRLNVGAAIHIQDSLQAGASRFYAEITRLRQVVELTQAELPLLFLLDEILSGTNSHDRRIGAAAVIKSLVERGALGLVTTHDLALTQIADELQGCARNVHFQDELKDGAMYFDYRMHEGIVQRSNALELMRAVGLDV